MFVKSIFVPVNVPCAGNTRMTGPLACQALLILVAGETRIETERFRAV